MNYFKPLNVFGMNLDSKKMQIYKFQPQNSECLMSNIKCSSLGEFPCASSGLAVIYKWPKMELRQKICQEEKLYQQQLAPNATLISILWMQEQSQNTTLKCQIWCTEN